MMDTDDLDRGSQDPTIVDDMLYLARALASGSEGEEPTAPAAGNRAAHAMVSSSAALATGLAAPPTTGPSAPSSARGLAAPPPPATGPSALSSATGLAPAPPAPKSPAALPLQQTESVLEGAMREWSEETGISTDRLRFARGAHLDGW